MPTTSNRIKELRNSTNPKTTLKELSEKLREKGLSFTDSQLSQYEQGNRSPRNSEIWQALAEIFNVSVGYLLGNTDMLVQYEVVPDSDLNWIIETYIQANESEKEFIKSAIKLVGDRLNLEE